MKLFSKAILFSVLLLSTTCGAQTGRLSDRNTIGWLTYTGTFNLSRRWGIHTEYQWRRADLLESWQQGLVRAGVNYKASNAVTLQAGLAYITTYAYGEYPLNAFGKTFPERRAYEQVTVAQKLGRLELQHRYRLEQRWIGRFRTAASDAPDEYVYSNRFRYMLRGTLPLIGATLDDHEPYLAAFDELIIGFGKNIGENIFDQNRIAVMAGYRFNKTFRVEGGYLNQTLQLPREIGGRNVIQYNNGFILSLVVNADLYRTDKK